MVVPNGIANRVNLSLGPLKKRNFAKLEMTTVRGGVMMKLLFGMLAALVAPYAVADEPEALDELMLHENMEQLQAAVNRGDVDEWMTYFTPDFMAEATVHIPTGDRFIRMNMRQYEQHIRGGMHPDKEFSVDYEIVSMNIQGARAEVHYRGQEFFAHDGRQFKSFVEGFAIAVLHEGRPKMQFSSLTIYPMESTFWDE